MPAILMVCTANICRSPIASALLQRKLQQQGMKPRQWQVASAGTWAQDGLPAAPKVRELMSQLGINLNRHRSRGVTSGLLQAADLILTMEQGHKEALQSEFPEIAGRVYLLSEMAGATHDVQDPIGGTTVDFQDAIREIYRLIEQGFDKIVSLAQANQR